MWFIGLYGFSILYLLACIFSYEIHIGEVLCIALIAWSIAFFQVKKQRLFYVLIVVTSILASLGSYWYFGKVKFWLYVKKAIIFISAYYHSVTDPNVFISTLHQVLLLILFGWIIYRLLWVFEVGRLKAFRLMMIPLCIVLIVIGFLLDRMNLPNDRVAMVIWIISVLIYYFYDVFEKRKTENSHKKEILSYLVLGSIMSMLMVFFALAMIKILPNPFEKKLMTYMPSDTVTEFESGDLQKTQLSESGNFRLQDHLNFKDVELFKVLTSKTKYYKSAVYERYKSGNWEQYKYEKVTQGNYLSESYITSHPEIYEVENVAVQFGQMQTRILFSGANQSFQWRLPEGILTTDAIRGTFSLVNPQTTGFVYSFDAVLPKYGTAAFDSLLSNTVQKRTDDELILSCLEIPTGLEEVQTLATQITAGIDNPYQKAKAIEVYLRKNFTYTETPTVQPEGDTTDPVVFFLKISHEGFCQQFASSMVLMLRTQQIPARFATGYAIDITPISEQLTNVMGIPESAKDPYTHVYDRNGHAWVEVYFDETGWIMMEPTPNRSQYLNYDNPLNMISAESRSNLEQTQLNQKSFYKKLSWQIGIGFFGFIFLGIILRTIFNYQRNKKATIEQKILWVLKELEDYFKARDLQKGISETLTEYAHRIDETNLFYGKVSFSSLMAEYVAYRYGQEKLTESLLTDFVAYLNVVKVNSKRTVTRVKFFNIRVKNNSLFR